MSFTANMEIGSRLRLVRLLGQGSAGQVWLAEHLALGSDVAVKLLNRDIATASTAKERFVREARAVARIRSPHVVQVHDFGFHEEHAYLVMEHLVGETLEDRLARSSPLPASQVLRIVTHIAKALQKAHDVGIVHRDIKPANVFIVDYGDEEVAKVVDFGVVKSRESEAQGVDTKTLTQAGALLGTPYYMSPEQIQDSCKVGPASDLWSLGIIAYECLVGRLPFDVDNFAMLLIAVCRDSPPVPSSLASVPEGFDAWVERALQREPENRFGSAREMAGELCKALMFSDAAGCIAVPENQSMPSDLLWSGSYPPVDTGQQDASAGTAPDADEDAPIIAISIEETNVDAGDPGPVPFPQPAVARDAVSLSTSVPSATVAASGDGAEPRRRPAARGTTVVAAAALISLVMFGLAGVTLGRWTDPDAGAAVPRASANPPAATVPDDSESGVELIIIASPPEAAIVLDGTRVSSNPFHAEVERDSRMHKICAKAQGYEEMERFVVFDDDVTVKLTLDPIAGEDAGSRVAAGNGLGARPNTKPHPAASAADDVKAEPEAGERVAPGSKASRPTRTIDEQDPYFQ